MLAQLEQHGSLKRTLVTVLLSLAMHYITNTVTRYQIYSHVYNFTLWLRTCVNMFLIKLSVIHHRFRPQSIRLVVSAAVPSR